MQMRYSFAPKPQACVTARRYLRARVSRHDIARDVCAPATPAAIAETMRTPAGKARGARDVPPPQQEMRDKTARCKKAQRVNAAKQRGAKSVLLSCRCRHAPPPVQTHRRTAGYALDRYVTPRQPLSRRRATGHATVHIRSMPTASSGLPRSIFRRHLTYIGKAGMSTTASPLLSPACAYHEECGGKNGARERQRCLCARMSARSARHHTA